MWTHWNVCTHWKLLTQFQVWINNNNFNFQSFKKLLDSRSKFSRFSGSGDNPPDILAFIITLLMMMIFFRGVKRSVMFNHVMNAINLMSCVIIVGFGLWFCRGYNWTPFMPFGLKGVVHGAATCFYAFIGFDIIATTGEESKNPRRSLPTSIISSLIITIVAYLSTSTIMTLIMPYDQLGTWLNHTNWEFKVNQRQVKFGIQIVYQSILGTAFWSA